MLEAAKAEKSVSKLFKYVSSSGAAVNLAAGTIKFTPIHELNDPSELTPVMDHDAVRASLSDLRKNGLSDDQFEWLKRQSAMLDLLAPEEKILDAPKTISEANHFLSLSVYENMAYMERKLFKTIMSIRSKVGVLSLSERYDSLPMWAHYADNGRGYVAVFNALGVVFPGDGTGSLNELKQVKYADWFEGMTFDPSTQDNLFFSKLSDWSYEREWRVVAPIEECRRSADGSLCLKDVDREHISAIICGWQVSSADADALRIKLREKNLTPHLICSKFERGRIKLLSDIPD